MGILDLFRNPTSPSGNRANSRLLNSRLRARNEQRRRRAFVEQLEDRRVLASIFGADFGGIGDGFADHTTGSPPAAGPAATGLLGVAPNQWELSYQSTPATDGTANEFSVEAGSLGQGANVLRIQDFGGEGRFESQVIDVSALSVVSVSASGLTVGNDVQNAGSEFFSYFYRLDGGADVTTDVVLSGDTQGTAVDWSLPSLNVAGVNTLTVGFSFNVNGAGDGYEISPIVVDDLGGGGAPGVTVTPSGGSLDVAEAGATSDTFDVVLNTAPTSDVTITLATPDGETSAAPSALTFTAANFSTPQSVTVTAVDDLDEEGTHTGAITVAVTSSDTDYNGLAVPDVIANIADNDVSVDLIISGVIDGPLPGGTPKAVELYALNDIPDLSVYGLGSANNGGGSDGSEVTLSGSVNAGNYIYVATTSGDFDSFFGAGPTTFGPIIVDGDATNINGDDAIELFKDSGGDGFDAGDLVDVFGDPNVDGTGEAWEYLDGWAYRNNLTAPSTTFSAAEWTFSGVDALDGETTNATATTPFPIGTYKDSNGDEVFILSGIDGTSVTEGGATGDFGVVLNAAPTANVTVTLATSDGETNVSPTALTFTPANFATAQTVTVTAVDDSDVEGGHTGDVTFTVTSADPGYSGASVLDEEISITDNDVSLAINEIRISHPNPGDNTNNFVEVFETAGTGGVSTAGVHLLVVSGEFSPGNIDFAIDLSSGTTDSDGFLLVADDGTTAFTDAGDILLPSLDFFGSPTTFMLVTGFTGVVGQDLDDGSVNGDNDGTFDVTPWTSVLDAVSLEDDDAVPTLNYAPAFGGPVVSNPIGSGFPPAAISARPDGTDSYEASVAPPADPFTDTTGDTPGFTNTSRITITEGGTTPGFTGVVEGGATDELSFVLNEAPTADVTITLATADGQTTVSSTSLTFTPANFATPQMVTVTAVDDALVEGSPHAGAISVSVTSADTSFDGSFVPDVAVAIGDNEGTSPGTAVINEARISHSTLDNASNNFVEIYTGAAGSDLTNLSVIVISERFAPGVVDFVFPLVGGTTDAGGFQLLHDDGFNSTRYTLDAGDLSFGNIDFFGSPQTILLVEGFHGQLGFDLDSGNDGVLDSTPWVSILDAVTFDDANLSSAGYGSSLIIEGPQLPNVPSGLRRRVDGGTAAPRGGFDLLQFNDDGPDTPGFSNVIAKGVRIIDVAEATSPGEAADLTISENGVTDTFGIVLDAEPTSNVTITLTTADGETSPSPNPLTFTPANWFEAQTVTLSAVDDGDDEGDHTGTIGISVSSADAGYNALSPPSLVADIVDNDNSNHVVVINEIHNDPFGSAPGDLAGDANGDGVRSASEDEFIEIVNTGAAAVDISGWTVSDDNPSVRHEFPAGTILAAGQAIVVFGGGTLGSYGTSTLVQAAEVGGSPTGFLGFGAADSAVLSDGVRTIDFHTWVVDDGIDDGVNNSLARIPNFTGAFVDQGSEDGFVTLFTPGVSNVLPFGDFVLGTGVTVTQTGNQAVTEGGAAGTDSDTFEVALNSAPTANVTITIAPDAQTTASVPALTFTPANFSTPQSVTITAVDDAVVEGGHTSNISLTPSSADAAYNGLSIPDVVVDVTDNDVDFQINEIRVSHTSLDNDSNNFLELYETGGNSVSTDGLTLVVIRSEDGGFGSPGTITQVFPLDSGVTDAAGFLLLHDDGFAGVTDPGDVSNTGLDFIGAPMTYVIVSGFTGIVGQDLDDGSVNLDNDGVFDVTPWNTVIDSITLDDIDGDADPTVDYSATLGGTKIDGLGDTFVLAAASALPDGSNNFSASAADPFNDTSGDTPGATNVSDATPPTITNVIIAGSTWTAPFIGAVGGNGLGYALPGADQELAMPWNNMDTIYIEFSEDVQKAGGADIDTSDLALGGINVLDYELAPGFGLTTSYSDGGGSGPFVLTISIVGVSNFDTDRLVLRVADSVQDAAGNALDGEWTNSVSTASGNGTAGGDLLMNFNILPGDTDRGGSVFANDVINTNSSQFSFPGFPAYDVFRDFDGSGSIFANDVIFVNGRQFNFLPVGSPIAPPPGSAGGGSSLLSVSGDSPEFGGMPEIESSSDDEDGDANWSSLVDGLFDDVGSLGIL